MRRQIETNPGLNPQAVFEALQPSLAGLPGVAWVGMKQQSILRPLVGLQRWFFFDSDCLW
jgi:hypothetical protein